MVFITEEKYKKFQASKYMGLLYENKMTCNVAVSYTHLTLPTICSV